MILSAVGIGFVTFTGVEFGIQAIVPVLNTYIMGLPADVLLIARLMGIPEGISIIVSALTFRLTFRFISTRKPVFNNPGS